jgi:GAF domain-containing protein
MIPPLPANEAARIEALKEYHILDTKPEQAYDDIVILAAHICKAPIAMISLVDEGRQWFKAKFGLSRRQTPRDLAFCAHAILDHKPMVVPDATKDKRFAGTALVEGEPHIRFYTGIPLTNSDGLAMGTLCVIDHRPRTLAAEELMALQALSRQVMALLESRRVSAHLAEALDHVKRLQALLPICAWCKRIRDDTGYWNQLEAYFHKRTGADFTHGICPECMKKLLPKEQPKSSAAKKKRRRTSHLTRTGRITVS